MKPVYFALFTALVFLFQGCAPDPVADFEYNCDDNTAPASVSFTNLSTDAEEYDWDFGDGSSSTESSPTHVYNDGGNFIITLRAIGKGGESTISKSIVIYDPTTYSIRNLTSVTLYDVTSYYWDGGEYFYDEVSHGSLANGGQTAEVITKRSEIFVDFKLEIGGGWYLVVDPYYMTQNTLNYCLIDGNTRVYGPVEKKSIYAEGHPRPQKNATPLLIRDIMPE